MKETIESVSFYYKYIIYILNIFIKFFFKFFFSLIILYFIFCYYKYIVYIILVK